MLQLPHLPSFRLLQNENKSLKDAKQLKLRVCVMYCLAKKRTVESTSNGSSATSVTTISVDTSDRRHSGPETWTSDRDSCYRQHLSVTGREGPQTNYSERSRNHHMQQEVQGMFFVCSVVTEDELELTLIEKQIRPSISKHPELTAQQWLLCRKWACLRKENRAGKSAP